MGNRKPSAGPGLFKANCLNQDFQDSRIFRICVPILKILQS